MTDDAFYFGCWDRLGHFLFDVHGRTRREGTLPADFPVMTHALDGAMLGYDRQQVEGRAYVAHVRGWTILSFWDRSVDKRYACSSNFILRGTLGFDAAVAKARAAFPQVWQRYKFEVVDASL